jgi:hypothetical protein
MVPESEILWLVEENNQIDLKFYYITKEKESINESKTAQMEWIRYTEFQLNLKELVNELPLKNSYDYEFIYGWNDGTVDKEVCLVPNEYT